jgi:hypothetical protein
MRTVGLAVVVLLFVAADQSGLSPYSTPLVEQPAPGDSGEFDGLLDLAKSSTPSTPVLVLWTHGMCTHPPSWVDDRLQRLLSAMGGTAETRSVRPIGTEGASIRTERLSTPSGTIDLSFLTWSPLTAAFKARLDRDGSTIGRRQSPFSRATLNDELKRGLVNNCLTDVVVYGGPNGREIRKAATEAMCGVLGGRFDGERCDMVAGTCDGTSPPRLSAPERRDRSPARHAVVGDVEQPAPQRGRPDGAAEADAARLPFTRDPDARLGGVLLRRGGGGAGRRQLVYVASAHLTDSVDRVNFTEPQRAFLATLEDPVLQEETRDMLLARQFRRDVFAKGVTAASAARVRAAWLDTRFALTIGGAELDTTFETPVGKLQLRNDVHGPLIDLLGRGPTTLREAIERLPQASVNWSSITDILKMLVGRGDLQPAMPAAGDGKRAASAHAFNRALLARVAESAEFRYLASPVTGGGVHVDRLSQFYLLARQRGIQDPTEMLAKLALDSVDPASGDASSTLEKAREVAKQHVARIERDVAPLLGKLAVV